MNDYIKQLEEHNEKLQAALTEALESNVKLQDKLDNSLRFIILVAFRVNGQYCATEVYHHLFDDPVKACKRLKKDWNMLRKDFSSRFGGCGFEFKYYMIESYNISLTPKNNKIPPSKVISWSFEDKKDIDLTLMTMEK